MKNYFPIYLVFLIFCFSIFGKISAKGLSESTEKSTLASDINGFVWFDGNGDGIFDNFENGIASVPVFLYTCSGQFVNVELTDGTGAYSFSGIADGNYKLYFYKENLPSNYSYTLFGQMGLDNDAMASGFTECFNTLEDTYELNGGFTILSSIGDFVWNDINGNGIQDFNESGIGSVVIKLFDSNQIQVGQTTSDVNGNYFFNFIFPGDYYIQFVTPVGYTITTFNNTNSGTDSDISGFFGVGTTNLFSVSAGQNRLDIDGGYYVCATICGILYFDINGNDLWDSGENGINGLMVNLWKLTDSGNLLYDTQITGNIPNTPSSDGYYEFCVPPGNYFVQVALPPPADYFPGLAFVGSDPLVYNHFNNANGPLTSYTISLIGGQTVCNVNQGFYCGGSFSNSVWLDENYDGIKDINEARLPGIVIEVFNDAFQNLGQTTSDENGDFHLGRLPKDRYYLKFSQPEGLLYTIPFTDGGFSSSLDCDVDNSFGVGTTPLYTLKACEAMVGVNAGYTLGPLPLIWSDFKVYAKEGAHKLEWNIQSEFHSRSYEVLRSYNNLNKFESLGIIESNNKISGSTYSFVDMDIKKAGNYYYKIKHSGWDNTISYSDIAVLNRISDVLNVKVMPNPSHDQVYISLDSPQQYDKVELRLYNTVGKLIRNQSYINQRLSQFVLDTQLLDSGTYVLEMILDGISMSKQKIIILK